MKKTFKLFALLAIALLFVVSACKKDDDDDPANQDPVLNFLVEQGYVNSDVTLTPGEAFKTKVYMAENADSKKNIDRLNVRRIKNNTTVYDTAYNIGKSEETMELNFNAQAAEGTETFEFEAVDNDGMKTTIRFIVTTVGPGSPLNSYTNITLGSYNDQTYGSFFSASTGTVYFKADATNNQGLIDFGFFLGATNGATIAAPNNADLISVFQLNWSTQNPTKFQNPAPIDAAAFTAIGNVYDFPAFTGTADNANQLVAGNVVYFQTANGFHGFIKVNQINDKGDIINIDVKFEGPVVK